MEQQLINAFMKLLSKAGGGFLIKDLIHHVEENGNPKVWSRAEMENAISFLNSRTETFGSQEAMIIIHTLIKKFELNPADIIEGKQLEGIIPEATGVKGLQ